MRECTPAEFPRARRHGADIAFTVAMDFRKGEDDLNALKAAQEHCYLIFT